MGRLAAHRADPKSGAVPESVAATESPAGSPRQGFRGRTITTAVLLAAVLLASRLWLVEPVTVSSESMEPALPKGSTVLMFKPGPALGSPKAGDLVVFTSPEDGSSAVKRAIAVGGQTVAIEDSVLVVDGVRRPSRASTTAASTAPTLARSRCRPGTSLSWVTTGRAPSIHGPTEACRWKRYRQRYSGPPAARAHARAAKTPAER
jgi:signal peptidase I